MARSDELNPEHPVTSALHEQWHKLCMILMDRLGESEILITEDEIKAWGEKYPDHAILAHAHKDGLTLKVVTMEEGRRLTMT